MLLAALAALGATAPDLVWADDEPVETQIVDAMNKIFGTHPGSRANHAKGTVVEGSFKASPQAAALSKAILFNGSTIPVTVRFSDATGAPTLPDGSIALPAGQLTDGIEQSDDPLIDVRNGAYAVSYSRRNP